jgi:U3 small nucleolar RNA-associated protein 18
MHIRRTPLHMSAFAPPTGNRIMTAGRRRFFHIWDLDTGQVAKINAVGDRKEEQRSMERFKLSPCGRYIGLVGTARKGGGLINVLDATTAQWIAQVRVDGRGGVADFAWWRDGEGMTVASRNGEISEWDGQLRRVVARWMDQGAVGTTVLNLGGSRGASGRSPLGGDRWVAVGSSSGVVNLYDRRAWTAPEAVPRNPSPTRMLDQLTTPITHLVFSPDGQLLAVASRLKRDAFRLSQFLCFPRLLFLCFLLLLVLSFLTVVIFFISFSFPHFPSWNGYTLIHIKTVHLPSCTVYRNWPTSSTPLGRISAVAVSPQSNYLAIGNEQGRLRLWEIHG